MARPGRQQPAMRVALVLAPIAVLVVVAVTAAVVLLGDGDDPVVVADDPTEDTDTDTAAAADETGPCPAPSGDLPTPTTSPYTEPPVADLGDATTVRATISTTCGDIVVDLDAAAAPVTVANFVGLAEDGYYDGVGFHRVIDDFMIQGGDPTGTGTGCVDGACTTQLPGYSFADELGLAQQVVEDTGGYPRGVVAMANRGPDTNGSQFFIVQAPSPYPLPPAYAVFGEVASGMDVVDRIALGPADQQLAVDPVVILDVDVQR